MVPLRFAPRHHSRSASLRGTLEVARFARTAERFYLPRFARERGAILLLAAVVVGFLALIGATFLAAASLQLSIASHERERGRARALARTALERAHYELGFDGSWAGTGGEVAVGPDAGYRVEVASSPPAVTVTCTGRFEARSVTLVAEGALRPYYGTIAVAAVGGSLDAREGVGKLVIDGDVHLSDPAGAGIFAPAAVSISGSILDEHLHDLSAVSLGGTYRPYRLRRPLPEVNFTGPEGLRELATVVYPRDGPIPAEFTGSLSGLHYVEADRDIVLRNVTVTGTFVVAPITENLYTMTLREDVTLDGSSGPAPGLALCAPGMVTTTVGRTRMVATGIVFLGRADFQGDPAIKGGTEVRGRILARLPAGGLLSIRPTNAREVVPGPPLDAYPPGLTGGSFLLESARITER